MKNPMLRRIGIVVSIVSALVLILGSSLAGVLADAKLGLRGTDDDQAVTTASTPSLHNPTFDNHDWYEFNGRYGNYLPGVWLPDDDNNTTDNIPLSSRQDWRIWYKGGTPILFAVPETTHVQQVEGVHMYPDTAWTSGKFFGGLYQVIYNTTPCLEYEFKMSAQARYEPPTGQEPDPFPTDWVNIMRVGIERTGWHLATNDPAVHDGDFTSALEWGESKKYYWSYGELNVTAEAWADKITVFTYADADGGKSDKILFDGGSFAEVTPAQIYDPADYTAPNGIYSLSSSVSGSSALITWNTSQDAISQIYYRRVGSSSPPPTETYTYTVYLPLVVRNVAWQNTVLNKVPTSSHSIALAGLDAGTIYEYIVVSKAYVSGDACSTWVAKGEFTTP
ncbi:MAG: hypothetical protein K8R89_00425 [Anaerolineae bacterium]|nr:hypothetical protein [Anaerolineae bacterium]